MKALHRNGVVQLSHRILFVAISFFIVVEPSDVTALDLQVRPKQMFRIDGSVHYDDPYTPLQILIAQYTAAQAGSQCPNLFDSPGPASPNSFAFYYHNGTANKWGFYTTYRQVQSNPDGSTSCITTAREFFSYVDLYESCGKGFNYGYKFTDAINIDSFCSATIDQVEPAPNAYTCNPVAITRREKVQPEVDYSAPNGLIFERLYRSKLRRFTSILDSIVIDRSSSGSPGRCVPMVFLRPGSTTPWPQEYYCFPLIHATSDDYLYSKPSGSITRFVGAPSTTTAPANINEQAVQVTDAQGVKTWRIKLPNNTFEIYSATGVLQRRIELNGRSTTYTYSVASGNAAASVRYLTSQTGPFGHTLQWQYDNKGWMVKMTDPSGLQYDYTYDVHGNTSAVMFPADNQGIRRSRTYHYVSADPAYPSLPINLLAGITNESGQRFSTYSYDTGGSVTQTKHHAGAGADVNQYSFSVGSGIDVTDPLGTIRKYSFTNILNYDYVTSSSQPAGAGCAAASAAASYDTQGNALSKDDFAGKRSCHQYDLARNLETARLEGQSNATACPADVAAYAIPAPAGTNVGVRKVSTTWHPDWRLEVRRAEPKKITTWVYNGQPDPTASNAIASCAPTTALLPDGKPIAVLCKQVEQGTTDATGTLGLTATAAGTARIWTYTYNSYGQVLTADGPRTDSGIVDKTTYTYYPSTTTDATLGDLATATNAAGHVTTYNRYDKHGRLLKMTDANGTVTDLTYHPRGWLLSRTVTASGATAGERTGYDYEPTGKLSKLTLPDGSTITYSYDGAQRLTGMIDSLGNSVAYTLDAIGNRTKEEVKDPGGALARNIARAYDALNRLQSVTGGVQ